LRRRAARWTQFLSALIGLLVGLGIFVWLIADGVPSTPSAEVEVTTTVSTSEKSGCPVTCKEPQTTESAVRAKTESPTDAGGESSLDKAFDNEAGVTMLRLIAALLSAYLTAVVVRRLVLALIGPLDMGGGSTTANLKPGPGSSSGNGAETKPDVPFPEKEGDLQRSEADPAPAKQAASRHYKNIRGETHQPEAEDTLDA
jgi:hypothetical protein